jgi:hypothetical protein
MARSRARATSPPNRAGTILVARNGSRPFPDKVPVPSARWLDRGLIKGSPNARRSSPHSGDAHRNASVRSLLARRKRHAFRYLHPGCDRLVLIPLARLRAHSRNKRTPIKYTLGFYDVGCATRKVHEVFVESHG